MLTRASRLERQLRQQSRSGSLRTATPCCAGRVLSLDEIDNQGDDVEVFAVLGLKRIQVTH